MSIICPTITEENPREAASWITELAAFASRVHFDFTDGKFAPSKTMNIVQATWPSSLIVDFHIMYQRPLEHLETIISLTPSLAIVHAEADGDLLAMMLKLKRCGIKAGVAILEDTSVDDARALIDIADHVLVFGGKLGFYGGTFRDDLLYKVSEIRALRPDIEIGWDGGVAVDNVVKLKNAGVAVCNVGGAIRNADDPAQSYKQLMTTLA